jgi:hypothetical protein
MKKTLLLWIGLLVCGLSHATVIYFTPNNNYFDWQSPSMYVDVNNDGFNDFLMTAEASTGLNTAWFKIKALTAGTKILTDGTGKVNGLNDSVLISSVIPANLWADSAWVYRWDGTPYPYPINIYSNMAIRFSDGAGNHFGYIFGLCMDDLGQGFYSYGIGRIGYESAPDAPIKAAAVTSIVGAPEPTAVQFQMSQWRDHLHLQFDRHLDATLKIHDLQGRTVTTTAMQGSNCTLETSALPPGVYILQATPRRTGQPLLSRKFVVMD